MRNVFIHMEGKKWVTAQDFSKRVGVCPATVWKWTKKGKLQTAKLGGVRLILVEGTLAEMRMLRERGRLRES